MLLLILQVSDSWWASCDIDPRSYNIIVVKGSHLNYNVDTETLQIFSGTLTKITCSAILPAFRLTKQNMDYDSDDYSQLPDLFDIEARVSPTGSNVTLLINGTSRSNNVTVICRNITSIIFGQVETLFRLELEFVSKFIDHIQWFVTCMAWNIITIDVLPPPSDVHFIDQLQDPAGQLQKLITWQQPTLFNYEFGSQIVSIDSRITHYLIYIAAEELIIVYNSSRTSFNINLQVDNISCSLSFQVAAVNPAGMGEPSPLQIVNCKLPGFDWLGITSLASYSSIAACFWQLLNTGEHMYTRMYKI